MIRCLILWVAVACSGAGHNSAKNELADPTNDSISKSNNPSEEFREFYAHFISDSLFQMTRIKFPLEGKKILNEEEYSWSVDNWVIMRVSIYELDTTEYKLEIQETDSLKSFRVFIPNSGFELLMKFELIDEKWYLVYCKDMFS